MKTAIVERLSQTQAPSEEIVFVFPELTLTAFVLENPKAMTLESPEVKEVQALAKELKTGIVFGFPLQTETEKPKNRLSLVDPAGNFVGHYDKLHLFTLGNPAESDRYTEGPRGQTSFLYRGWRMALSICFDLRYADLYVDYRREGAEVIVAAACWVGGPSKALQFETLSRARAIEAQAYLCAVNRIGEDPRYKFEGGSFVFSPMGESLMQNDQSSLIVEEPLLLAKRIRV
jgi:predicted amidohydrolase